MRRDLGQPGEWRHVVVDQVVAGRQRVIRRRVPPVRLQQLPGHAIGGIPPRREHRHVTPLANGGAGLGTGFEHHKRLAAREKMGGGGEAHWASPDNGNWQ